jgi:hypothetical protein
MLTARLVLVVSLAGLASCGEGLQEPSPITLRVSVAALGIDHPAEGYLVRIGQHSAYLAAGHSAGFALPAGAYDVELQGVAPNCTLEGDAVTRVVIPPSVVASGSIPAVVFQVECRAASGAIEVATLATGRDYDPNVVVVVDAGTAAAVAVTIYMGGSATVESVLPGAHEVTVRSVSDNCTPTQSGGVPVTVTAGGPTRDTSRITLEFVCEATTGDASIVTQTTGGDVDPDGYTLKQDGTLLEYPDCRGYYCYYGYYPSGPIRLDLTGEFFQGQLTPGNHTYELSDIAANCAVQGSNPRTASVVVGETTEVRFLLVCTDIP